MTAFNQFYADLILNELEKNNKVSFGKLYKETKIPHTSFVSTLKRLQKGKTNIQGGQNF